MDFVRDILERLAKALPAETLTEDMAQELERSIRDYWAGDRVYISRHGGDVSERNEEIKRDWRAGERISLLARRYKRSRVRIWQIVRNEPKTVKSLP